MFRVLECPCKDISSCNNSVEYPGNSDSVIAGIVTISGIMENACISIHVAVFRNHDRYVK